VSKRAKCAVVTGGARGIGRAIALGLAHAGCNIAIVDLLREEAEETRRTIEAQGADARIFHADVSDLQRAHEAVVEICEEFSTIDILVNNAGRTMPKSLLEITESEWDSTIDTNLKGCFCWCKAVAPVMLEQGSGRIINISSLNAINGGVTSAVSKFAYAAAKAGVLGLTRGLAKELAPNIVVNAICPGIVTTELTEKLLAEREEELKKGISLNRLGKPQDIAEAAVFLAMAENMFMTGQHIIIDGGQWVC
jgi:3-oxoacyl-[acyl-carrier protein] reductase